MHQRHRRHDAVRQRARLDAAWLSHCTSRGRARASYVNQTSPFDAYVHYFGGYAQDDWRLSPKTTINLGVRLEHETGLAEKNNGFTVAFDCDLNPGGALGNVVNQLTGQPIRVASSTPVLTAPTNTRAIPPG